MAGGQSPEQSQGRDRQRWSQCVEMHLLERAGWGGVFLLTILYCTDNATGKVMYCSSQIWKSGGAATNKVKE